MMMMMMVVVVAKYKKRLGKGGSRWKAETNQVEKLLCNCTIYYQR